MTGSDRVIMEDIKKVADFGHPDYDYVLNTVIVQIWTAQNGMFKCCLKVIYNFSKLGDKMALQCVA